jgi:uncharacterized membrane protein YsdA (DUF1294 family)
MKYVVAYIVIVNILAFCLYGIDKSAAIRQRERIPNRILLLLAVFGGSLGALIGMYTFRHKTKKWYYTVTVPVLLIIQIAAAVLLLSSCGASYNQISQDEAMQMMQEQTDYLITNTPDSGSAKNKKADALGVKKLSEAEFNRLIGRTSF